MVGTIVVRAALLVLLAAGILLFHRAGMARIQRGSTVTRLQAGMRNLTAEETAELRRLQQNLEEVAALAWLSPAHLGARRALCTCVARLADAKVPLSQVAGVMGVTKQRAHQQAKSGRQAT
jgi:hypothetical protein